MMFEIKEIPNPLVLHFKVEEKKSGEESRGEHLGKMFSHFLIVLIAILITNVAQFPRLQVFEPVSIPYDSPFDGHFILPAICDNAVEYVRNCYHEN